VTTESATLAQPGLQAASHGGSLRPLSDSEPGPGPRAAGGAGGRGRGCAILGPDFRVKLNRDGLPFKLAAASNLSEAVFRRRLRLPAGAGRPPGAPGGRGGRCAGDLRLGAASASDHRAAVWQCVSDSDAARLGQLELATRPGPSVTVTVTVIVCRAGGTCQPPECHSGWLGPQSQSRSRCQHQTETVTQPDSLRLARAPGRALAAHPSAPGRRRP
jgi:hypothetical protein